MLTGIFMLAVMILLIGLVAAQCNNVDSEGDKTKIVALVNGKGTEGAFFLGSGQIDTQLYYFYYVSTPDGGKKLDKVAADNTTIYEEDRADSYISEILTARTCNVLGLITDTEQNLATGRYAIHVPKGSIKEIINLDLNSLH